MDEEMERVIASIRSGDREAMNRFAQDYGPLIRMLAQQWIDQLRVKRETEADEILDATILKLCQRAERIEASDANAFWAYVGRIVRSQVNQVWRSGRTHKRGAGRQNGREDVDIPDPNGDARANAELRETLSCIYDQLSGDERVIAMLRRSGCSWYEIATRLGTTKSAVRKRWERAIERVLELLG